MVVILLNGGTAYSEDAIYNVDEGYNRDGWHVFAWDDDIDVNAELVTELDTTYAQLAANATVEALRGAHSSTADVTIVGIDSDGEQVTEVIRVTTTTSKASTNTFKFVDQVWASPEIAYQTTIQNGSTDTFVISVPTGETGAGVAQHFSGEKFSYITAWGGSMEELGNTSATGEVIMFLRYYPDDLDSRDAGDGFRLLDMICLSDGFQAGFREFATPIKCAKNSWIAIYASADVANSCVSAIMQGYDSMR